MIFYGLCCTIFTQSTAEVSKHVYLPFWNFFQIWSWQEVCMDKSVCCTAEFSLYHYTTAPPRMPEYLPPTPTHCSRKWANIHTSAANTWHQVITTWFTHWALSFSVKPLWDVCADKVECVHVQSHLHVQLLTVHTCNSIMIIHKLHYTLCGRCSRCPRYDPLHWNYFWEFWRS